MPYVSLEELLRDVPDVETQLVYGPEPFFEHLVGLYQDSEVVCHMMRTSFRKSTNMPEDDDNSYNPHDESIEAREEKPPPVLTLYLDMDDFMHGFIDTVGVYHCGASVGKAEENGTGWKIEFPLDDYRPGDDKSSVMQLIRNVHGWWMSELGLMYEPLDVSLWQHRRNLCSQLLHMFECADYRLCRVGTQVQATILVKYLKQLLEEDLQASNMWALQKVMLCTETEEDGMKSVIQQKLGKDEFPPQLFCGVAVNDALQQDHSDLSKVKTFRLINTPVLVPLEGYENMRDFQVTCSLYLKAKAPTITLQEAASTVVLKSVQAFQGGTLELYFQRGFYKGWQ